LSFAYGEARTKFIKALSLDDFAATTKIMTLEDRPQIIKSLNEGTLDIVVGNLGDNLPSAIHSLTIAKDSLVVVVNPNNTLYSISRQDLAAIFRRDISNWKDLGGKNEPIMVIDYDNNSVVKKFFYDSLFNSQTPASVNSFMVKTSKEVQDSIKKFGNAISYISYSQYDNELKLLQNKDGKGKFFAETEVKIYYNPQKLIEKNKFKQFKELLKVIYNADPHNWSYINYQGLTDAEREKISKVFEIIYLGVGVPLDGLYTDLSKSIINAAELAVDYINAQGEINGRTVELLVCNDHADIYGAVDCANRFVNMKVAAVIGHLNSVNSIEAAKIYSSNNIVMISPGSTNPEVTNKKETKGFVFRTIGTDDKQAKLIASFISSLHIDHPSSIAIFHNSTDYGDNLAKLIKKEVSQGSDSVKHIKGIKQNQHQYHHEIENLDEDILVFIGEYGDAAQMVKELALLNKRDIIFIGADGVFSQRYINLAGLRSEGTYIVGNVLDSKHEVYDKFKADYRSRFKTDPNSFAFNSFEATMIVLNSLIEAENKNISLSSAVKATDYNGITGKIQFNVNGDPLLPRMKMYQVKSGQFNEFVN